MARGRRFYSLARPAPLSRAEEARGHGAFIPSQAKTMAVALAKQTIAWAARGMQMQLPYRQKIPSEPKTWAIPNNAARDRRSTKSMS